MPQRSRASATEFAVKPVLTADHRQIRQNPGIPLVLHSTSKNLRQEVDKHAASPCLEAAYSELAWGVGDAVSLHALAPRSH